MAKQLLTLGSSEESSADWSACGGSIIKCKIQYMYRLYGVTDCQKSLQKYVQFRNKSRSRQPPLLF